MFQTAGCVEYQVLSGNKVEYFPQFGRLQQAIWDSPLERSASKRSNSPAGIALLNR